MNKRTIQLLLLIFAVVYIPYSQGQQGKKSVQPNKSKTEVIPIQESSTLLDKREVLLGKLKQIYGKAELDIQEIKGATEPGYAASGVLVSETPEEITIDTTPCSNNKLLITFHREYRKRNVSSVTCDDKKYNRVKVKQR